MIADAMATVGVIVGAVAIMTWGITWIDPVITALIAVYIFRHAYKEIREAIAALMDSAPKDFDYDGLLAELKAIPSVEDVHHLHVWQPDEGRTALEGHIAVSEQDLAAVTDLKGRIKARLKERFGIDHATLEFELASHVRHSRELLQDR